MKRALSTSPSTARRSRFERHRPGSQGAPPALRPGLRALGCPTSAPARTAGSRVPHPALHCPLRALRCPPTTTSGLRRATTPQAACRTAASPGWSWPSRRWGCRWLWTAQSTGWWPAAGGGQYLREFQDQPDGSRAPVWVRHPQEVDIVVPLVGGEFGPLPVNSEGIVLRGRVTRSEAGPWLVTVFLSNEQEQVDGNKDSRWMFQARLDLAAADGAAVFLGRGEVLAGPAAGSVSEQAEVAQLDLQYRDVVEFAVGHGVGTDVEVSADDRRRAARAGHGGDPQLRGVAH